jgi:hypothetical protein
MKLCLMVSKSAREVLVLRTHGQHVDPAEDENQDSRTDHHTPKWHAERLLTTRRLVEVAHDVDADDNHRHGEGYEAMAWAQKWPVAGKVAPEYRQFRGDEKD